MVSLRKASAYSKRKVTPYTRTSKKKGKAYIKTLPPQNIVKFKMGSNKFFPHLVTVVVNDVQVQIRDNALEACRQFINKKVDRELAGQYVFRVIPFPHHIQRENKMLTGAGADRMQTGMQLSFGKTVGKAAIIKNGGKIFEVGVMTLQGVQIVRQTMKQIQSKLPCKIKILHEVLKE